MGGVVSGGPSDLGPAGTFSQPHPRCPCAPAALRFAAGSRMAARRRNCGRSPRTTSAPAQTAAASGSGRLRMVSSTRATSPIARFSAGQGQGDQAQNTLSIHGGAHLRLEGDGTTVDTEEVDWQGPQRQLWLPRPILLTRAGSEPPGEPRAPRPAARPVHRGVRLRPQPRVRLSGASRRPAPEGAAPGIVSGGARLACRPRTAAAAAWSALPRRAVSEA